MSEWTWGAVAVAAVRRPPSTLSTSLLIRKSYGNHTAAEQSRLRRRQDTSSVASNRWNEEGDLANMVLLSSFQWRIRPLTQTWLLMTARTPLLAALRPLDSDEFYPGHLSIQGECVLASQIPACSPPSIAHPSIHSHISRPPSIPRSQPWPPSSSILSHRIVAVFAFAPSFLIHTAQGISCVPRRWWTSPTLPPRRQQYRP